MRITVSSTRAALNIGMDQEALTAALNGRPRIFVKFDALSGQLILCGRHDQGNLPYRTGGIWYVNIKGGFRGYSKHGKIVFQGDEIILANEEVRLSLPRVLPAPIVFLKRTSKLRASAAHSPALPKPITGANMVMTIDDMTICFTIPPAEALKIAFSMGAKGYMIEGAKQ